MSNPFEEVLQRRAAAHDVCVLPIVHRIETLLDRKPMLEQGAVLPRGWHFCLFTPLTPQSSLRPDGQVSEDSILSNPDPRNFPRRVLGGRRTTFLADLHIGSSVRRESRVRDAEVKEGRSGPFLRVTIRHELIEELADGPAIVEEQDSIFLPPSHGKTSTPSAAAASVDATICRSVVFDETMLFRYSAITFNAHRIHYDAPYAERVEGYPRLVVNGGLSALMLLELARAHINAPIQSIATRNTGVLHAGNTVFLKGAPTNGVWTMWAEAEGGVHAVEMTVS